MKDNIIKQKYLVHLVFIVCCNVWGSVQAGDVFKGAEIYALHCQQCHGADGRGILPNAPDFTRGDGLMRTDLDVFKTIRTGKGIMPAFEAILDEREILDVIAHLRSLQR